MKRTLLTFLAVAAMSTGLTAQTHPLLGGLIKSPGTPAQGQIYKIPTDGSTVLESTGIKDSPTGGAALIGNTYYIVYHSKSFFDTKMKQHLYTYDADTEKWTWVKTLSKDDAWEVVALDMTYDENDKKIYGCFYSKDGKGFEFGSWEVAGGVADVSWLNTSRTTISTIDKTNPWRGVASAPDGTLYAIDQAGSLLKVDKNTGATVEVGSTGLTTTDISSSSSTPPPTSSATVDPANGRLYYACQSTDGTTIYEIDTATASATPVASFAGHQFAGLAMQKVLAEGKAPAAVSVIDAVFNGNSLTGRLNFTAPATTFDGEPAQGALTYTVTVDGQQCPTDNTTCGSSVSVPVTVDIAGQHEFGVSVANAVGSSPETTVSAWVGDDVPAAPENVVFTYADGRATITWDAVQAGQHGGYIDPAAVTYTVTRYPGGDIAARDITATTWSENLSEPDGFTDCSYAVVATYAGAASESTSSNTIKLGGLITPPYTNDFSTQALTEGFTMVNLNDDDREWTYDSRRMALYINSSSYKKMDAWLITPRVRLEAGKTYLFSFNASAYEEEYTESVEVFAGTGPSPDKMTIRITEKTDVTQTNIFSNKLATINGEITVPASGIYYIGIHGCGDPDQFRLGIHDVSVGAGTDIPVPQAPGIIAATDPDGVVAADIVLTAPTKDVKEEELATGDITKIELFRDNQLIHTFDTPTPEPGATLNHTDDGATRGLHTYSAIAYNAGGAGQKASASLYVGIDLPEPPSNAVATETEAAGEITISWDAPAADIHGAPLKPSLLTYTINDESGTLVAENVSGTSYTYQAVAPDGRQTVKQYRVYAVTSTGTSRVWTSTKPVSAGPAFTLPVTESFTKGNLFSGYIANDNCTWIMQIPQGSGARWQLYGDGDEVSSQDGDGGFAGCLFQKNGDSALLYSGNITLDKAVNPAISFHYYGFLSCHNTIDVQINDGSGFKTVKTITAGADKDGWCQAIVPVGDYAGKTVQIGFLATVVDGYNVLIDNVAVKEMLTDNLIAASITVPRKLYTDKANRIEVRVANEGLNTADGYSVELYRDGELAQTTDGPSLAAGGETTVTFTETPGVNMGRTIEYYAVVSYEADANPDDNTTNTVTATLVIPAYPTVRNLKAVSADNGIGLAWDAPDMSTAPAESVTDDFEKYGSFSIDKAGQWSFIDADGAATHGFDDELAFPGMKSPMAYTVFDNTGITDTNLFDAHSGCRYMASFASTSGKNDDWLISPELNGQAQTINFFAKTFDGTYGNESFEFLYSKGGKSASDFVKAGGDNAVPNEWKEYDYAVPEGTRYFAIRCVSENRFIFFVDDVTYVPANAGKVELELTGYNIYRDGVRLNEQPVAETTFTDANGGAEDRYSVSAVYAQGESALCPEVSPMAGIDAVSAGTPVISGGDGHITVDRAGGLDVTVYAASGTVMFHTPSAADRLRVDLLPGVYVVRVGSVTVKTIVR